MFRLPSPALRVHRTPLMAPRAFATTRPRKIDEPVHNYAPDPSVGPMLRYERSLPRLPVPPLASTAAKYLDTIQPLLTPAAYANTKAAVEEFVTSPLGAELQKRLEIHAAEPDRPNWLTEWWNEAAYFGYRDPVVIFVSYFFVHLDDKTVRTPARRAARLLHAVLAFRELTETEQLEPDKARGIPLAMSSYKWLFNACRYPEMPKDTAQKFSPAAHNHVVFVRKNRFFEVSVVENGELLTVSELEAQIERVIRMAGDEKAPPVGALTSENRDVWSTARRDLISASPINAASMKRIESAIIIVALDDHKPVTREDISWHCWAGDGRNRFYDKHQLIVFDNGRSGFLGEHSCMDGTPTLRMNEFILARANNPKNPAHSLTKIRSLPEPKALPFYLDAVSLSHISKAEHDFDALAGQHELLVLHYEGYGKDLIKKYKISPDAWVQLLKQLAWKKLYNRPGVTYESTQTRKFQQGRTEVIRSASNESKAWTEAMADTTVDDTLRASLFRNAVKRHMQYAAWASDAQGTDRHFFGLKKLLREGEPVPRIYTDPAYAQSSHWELSTSQLSSPFIDGWGYGEVVPDGYGLAYAIGDNYIRWTITSMRKDIAEVRHCLAEAATETRQMMERASATAGEQSKL